MNNKVKNSIIACLIIGVCSTLPPIALAQTATTSAAPRTSTSRAVQYQKQIDALILALQKEIQRTNTLKDSLPQTEYTIIITQIQRNITTLETLKTQVLSKTDQENKTAITEVAIRTKQIPHIKLRRKAALLYQYNNALAVKQQQLYTSLQTQKSNTALYTKISLCLTDAESKRATGLGLLNGVLSQLGLIDITPSTASRALVAKLNSQLQKSKIEFDKARNQIRSCERQLNVTQ